ncbi:hypothetical protein QBC34DRAFT_398011 [Podospora aff. communis PSN243]|uniref:Uncharacterized protein n=1 Tax=Podospora aff. communis PSN243 TaxID=3040156 RepID=A0AAV9GY19_9PEZI|nr:hypothetical protein QBC34DRAFT_398011 [Podospora aff. communis PSN243]
MEVWLERNEAIKKGTQNVAHVFRFDTSKVLSQGKAELERLSTKLHLKLRNKIRKVSDFANPPESRAITGDEPGARVLIVIAHGLGVWLVKHMLSQGYGLEISIRCRDLIPLDCLVSAEREADGAYANYLESLSATLSVKCAEEDKLLELDKMMWDIDKDFAVHQESHDIRVTSPLVIWPSNLSQESRSRSLSGSIRDPRLNLIFRILGKFPRSFRPMPNKAALTDLLREVVKQHDTSNSLEPAVRATRSEPPPSREHEFNSGEVVTRHVDPPLVSPEISVDSTFQPEVLLGLETMDLVRSPSQASHISAPITSAYSARESLLVLPLELAGSDNPEWEKVYNQARSFIGRGQFKSASVLCTRAKKLLPTPDNGGQMPTELVRVQMQMEIINLLSGSFQNYSEATESLKTLKSKCPSSERVILVELSRWLAESLALQGKYREAAKELQSHLQPSGIKKSLATRKMIILGTTDNQEEIAALRELALTFAYLGFLTRAQLIINFLLQYLNEWLKDNFIRATEPGPLETEAAGTELTVPNRPSNTRRTAMGHARDSVLFTAAAIYTLSGNYNKAFGFAEESWKGRKQRLGGSHIKTIEALSLVAHLMALTGRSHDAEVICNQTLKKISSTELGPRHPQAIRLIKTLVFIFRIQSRLVEAVDTGNSLCEILVSNSKTRSHPETLKARAELASCLRSAGKYKAAEDKYAELVVEAHEVYENDPEHPETLRLESELAHIYASAGRLEQAEAATLETLWRQRHAYQFEDPGDFEGDVDITSLDKPRLENTPQGQSRLDIILRDLEYEYALHGALESISGSGNTEEGSPAVNLSAKLKAKFLKGLEEAPAAATRTQLEHMNRIWGELDNSCTAKNEISSQQLHATREKLRSRLSRLRVHPWLLHTMQILAWIKLRRQDSDIDYTCRMIEIVLKWRKKTLGDFHDLTLISEYDLAMAMRECNNLEQARQGFQTIYTQRRARLGKTHPETLSAKRELIITCSALQQWEDPENLNQLGRTISTETSGTSSTQLSATRTYISDPSRSHPSLTELSATASSLLSPTTTEPSVVFDTHYEPRPILREGSVSTNTHQLTLGDWTCIEQQSLTIALEQEARIGASHPETINTLLWVFAVQLLIGKISEGAQTLETLLSRLRDPAVREQRLLNSLQTEEKVASICLEQGLEGSAVDILEVIKSQTQAAQKADSKGKQTGGTELLKELQLLCKRCDEKLATAREEKGRILEEITAAWEEAEMDADKDVYLVNALGFMRWAGLGGESKQVVQVRGEVERRVEGLLRGSERDAVDRVFHLLEPLIAKENSGRLRSEVNRLLTPEGGTKGGVKESLKESKGKESKGKETQRVADGSTESQPGTGGVEGAVDLCKSLLRKAWSADEPGASR